MLPSLELDNEMNIRFVSTKFARQYGRLHALRVSASNLSDFISGQLRVGAAFLGAISHVVVSCAKEQMLRAHTAAIACIALCVEAVTIVQHEKTFRDRPIAHQPRNIVGQFILSAVKSENTVSIKRCDGIPKPAGLCLADLFPKLLSGVAASAFVIARARAKASGVFLSRRGKDLKGRAAYFASALYKAYAVCYLSARRGTELTLSDFNNRGRNGKGFVALSTGSVDACYSIVSHEVNLQSRFTEWLGSFERHHLSCGPFSILAETGV